MQILRTPTEMQEWSLEARHLGQSVGFVPTMGALHRGHATLMRHSVQENNVSVLSIFVNPTQFNVADDFEKYPRTFETDLEIARENQISAVYAPTVETMYPPSSSVTVQPGTASHGMEGAMRPGHFEGVTTVVAKLFNSVLPHRAYFGKKDYQQLAVIRQMVVDLNFPIEIIGVDTVREADGLALSSRNVRLTQQHRDDASAISQGLFTALRMHQGGVHDSQKLKEAVNSTVSESQLAKIEYVEICHPTTLTPIVNTQDGAVICVAAWYGDVRLIDNIELPSA